MTGTTISSVKFTAGSPSMNPVLREDGKFHDKENADTGDIQIACNTLAGHSYRSQLLRKTRKPAVGGTHYKNSNPKLH